MPTLHTVAACGSTFALGLLGHSLIDLGAYAMMFWLGRRTKRAAAADRHAEHPHHPAGACRGRHHHHGALAHSLLRLVVLAPRAARPFRQATARFVVAMASRVGGRLRTQVAHYVLARRAPSIHEVVRAQTS